MKTHIQLICSTYLRIAFVVLILCCSKSYAAIRYVKPGSAGTAPYTTWATASNDLQAVINYCNPGDEIWIAAGTYKPNRRADALTVITTANRNNAFVMKDGVKIYGGFNGIETSLNQINVVANVVILSGDIGVAGITTDNCYHVVINAGTDEDGLLYGVTVQDGYANGAASIAVNGYTISRSRGGGIFNIEAAADIYGSVIRNNYAVSFGGGVYDSATYNLYILGECTVTQNTSDDDGGGIYISNSSGAVFYCSFTNNQTQGNGGGFYQTPSSTIQIRSCEFSSNVAAGNGAGLYWSTLSNSFENEIRSCLFSGNEASGNGGGVYNNNVNAFAVDAVYINCIFSGNLAASGGGLYNAASDVKIINCTIGGNRASGNGGGIANSSSTTLVRNSVLYGNTAAANNNYYNTGSTFTVEYSIVQGGYAGTNNSSANPLFVSPVSAASAPVTGGDYHLQKCSPAINGGRNAYISEPGEFTLTSSYGLRIYFGTVDMGAYEYRTNFAVPDGNGIVYVDYTKTGNGSSWTNAVPELADALIAAKYNSGITQIWVAKGTYYPKYNAQDSSSLACDNSNRDNAFVIVDNVKIFGGFAGGETAVNQRNFATNICILSGDIGTVGSNTDNCYHVVISAGAVTGTALNGFFIRYGNANGSGNITVNSISVGRGSGAGMRISSSSPNIINCVFSANSTTNNGGGMVCDNSSPAITNCVFSGNRANDGGAILNTNASATELTNCTFAGNIASATGGAIRNGNSSSPVISNCIIWNNWVGLAADAIYNADAGSVPVVNYCVVQGGYAGTGNISTNPLFVNALAPSFAPTVVGDYRMQDCSPCINAGDNSYVPGSINNDVDYKPRVNYGKVDMGAYEKQLQLAVPDAAGIVYVDSTKNGNGSSWDNAVKELADALVAAKYNSSIMQVWVAKGTYYPKYNPAEDASWNCSSTSRKNAFVLVDGVKVFGGFAGGETDTLLINPGVNITTLSGNIGSSALTSDNAYHVVISSSNSTGHLAGFNIIQGEAVPAIGYIVNGVYIDPASGGGLHARNSALYLRQCNFFDNSVETFGAGLYFEDLAGIYHLTIVDCNFINNQIKSNYSAGGDAGAGAAMFINSPAQALNVNISGCNVNDNKALHLTRPLHGGGIIALGKVNLTITDCDFKSNKAAALGGAIYFLGFPPSSFIASNVHFEDDSARFGGGALYFNNVDGSIKNCSFLSNKVSDHGGAVSLYQTNLAIDKCIFSGNISSIFNGSAVHAQFDNSVFSNCLFSGNRSNTAGTGYFSVSNTKLTGCTFSGNKLNTGNNGSAITSTSGSDLPEISNSVFWGNVGQSAAGNPIISAGPVTYSIVEGGFSGTGNVNSDPLFLNPQPASAAPTINGDYRLQRCSPSINAGSNALIPSGIAKDLDSSNRIAFATVDMGAYELQTASPDASGIVYVDNTKNGNGSTWANAEKELAFALLSAKYNSSINQIWVAKGTYYPKYAVNSARVLECDDTNRDNAFELVNDVKVFGGFAGGETDTTGRNFTINETKLSGDIGVLNTTTDNVYHVALSTGAVGSALINGFTINNGNANAATVYSYGGRNMYRSYGAGLYTVESSPAISQCNFLNNNSLNYGGAMYGSLSSSSIEKCYFSTNTAGKQGGAINLVNCTSYISNTIFSANAVNGAGPNNYGGGLFANNSVLNVKASSFLSNSVLNGDGGGVVNELSTGSVYSSCIFSGNTASNRAGGYHNLSSVSALHNSVFTGNISGTGGGAGVYNALGASLTLTNSTISGNNTTGNGGGLLTASPCTVGNSIIHNNTATISSNNIYSVITTPTVNNSIIQGGYAGTGNYDIDPLFVSPQSPAAAPTTSGDYRLQACSPALNLGNNSLIPPGLTKDLDSLNRVMYGTVDMGAYEKQTIDLNNTTWKGVNSNWNDKINWCGGYIPVDTTNVVVPATANNPLINAGYDNEVNNISFANNTSIDIASTSKLTINGIYTNNGSAITNNGDWVMAGNANSQTFPGTLATVSAMNNLEVNNSNGLKFDKSFQLTGTLTPTAGNINVDNATVTLNSDATATAKVATVPSGVAFSYTGTGKFEVERYIPPHRAWRLLTAPLSTATNLTISDAWQEGVSNANRLSPVNPAPGYGTTITKSTTYSATDGYDQGSTNNPSIRFYNGSSWGGVPSATNGTTVGANNGLINDKQGYMLFVRGDRGIQVAGTGVTATVTTLRPKGQLNVGPQIINCTGWTVIGNPYTSPINFHKIVIDNPGLPDVFYVWDANLAGSSNVGGWVSYSSYSAGTQTYTVAPLLAGSTFANNKGDISSGSAFMINYTGTITINENNKSTLGDNVLYRPTRQLSMNLYVVNADSSESLNDGLAIKMDASPNAANAEKNKNFTENLAVAFDNKLFAIQNRRRPNFNDTIFISTGQMKQRSYVLEIQADKLNMPNSMKAFLEDTYLHQYKPVALEGNTRYAFSVNADSASVSSARFRLLFKKSAKFAHIHAIAKEKDIEVQWKMDEDFGITHYEIERSLNEFDFTTIKNEPTNKQQLLQNQWLDVSPATGTYYYRIKATGIDGEVLYSAIAKASMVKNNAGMYIYPNPVTNGQINLRMNKMPSGIYTASLVNAAGQVLFKKQWVHKGGFVTKQFSVPTVFAGHFQLIILEDSLKKQILPVEIINAL